MRLRQSGFLPPAFRKRQFPYRNPPCCPPLVSASSSCASPPGDTGCPPAYRREWLRAPLQRRSWRYRNRRLREPFRRVRDPAPPPEGASKSKRQKPLSPSISCQSFALLPRSFHDLLQLVYRNVS